MKKMSNIHFRPCTCCMLVAAVFLMIGALPALAAPVIVQNSSGDLSLVTLPGGGGTASVVGVSSAGYEYNNMGWSSTQNALFALELTGSAYQNGQLGVVQINPSTGAVSNIGFATGLPTGAATRFDAGDVNGNSMYVSFGASDVNSSATYNQTLYTIDLSSPSLSTTSLAMTGPNAWVNDWAYDPTSGLLYGGDQISGNFVSLNPSTGARTNVATGILPSGVAFGAAWYDPNDQNIYLYRNHTGTGTTTGTIYQVTTAGVLGSSTWTAPRVTLNDGTYVPDNVPIVPIPGAIWLLVSGLIGLVAIRRRTTI